MMKENPAYPAIFAPNYQTELGIDEPQKYVHGLCFDGTNQILTSDGDLRGCQGRPEGGVHLDP
jgi:hypothetical protein